MDKQNGELAIYYEMGPEENMEQRGIIETDNSTSRWQNYLFYYN